MTHNEAPSRNTGRDLVVVGLNTDWGICPLCDHRVMRGEVAVMNSHGTRHQRCMQNPRKGLRVIPGGLHGPALTALPRSRLKQWTTCRVATVGLVASDRFLCDGRPSS